MNEDTDVVAINRQNNNDAVVISLAHYSSLIETLYLLGSPANAAHLAKSIAQYKGSKSNSKN